MSDMVKDWKRAIPDHPHTLWSFILELVIACFRYGPRAECYVDRDGYVMVPFYRPKTPAEVAAELNLKWRCAEARRKDLLNLERQKKNHEEHMKDPACREWLATGENSESREMERFEASLESAV